MPIISSVRHPYWAPLGAAAQATRRGLQISQAVVARHTGLTVRQYAALESGFIPPDVADGLGRMSFSLLDEALGWDEGTTRAHVEKALAAAMFPTAAPSVPSFQDETPYIGDRSHYPPAAWIRLGKAVRATRLAEKLTRSELAYAMRSSSKTIMRLEEGRIYGDPRNAPPGDYNSERYILSRLVSMEFYLGWERDHSLEILNGRNEASVSPAA
ncbi:helix-turn-helix domain-containing protein [Streptomyces sp. NPDC048281]|uniref:helix-turn-helix domain-containing protein n=1 Tax=Streptomyces sp. NPDC048281 TaxID=3154715 RepID=UPI003431C29F